jgi:hypothetical protein
MKNPKLLILFLPLTTILLAGVLIMFFFYEEIGFRSMIIQITATFGVAFLIFATVKIIINIFKKYSIKS